MATVASGEGAEQRTQVQTELSRDLGCFHITMIGVGAMIGAGIFVLTGIAAGTAGPALILAFALNGVVTVFTAMAYAELGSAIPEAGGGYRWVKEGLPGGQAFLAGWMSWFAHAAAGSLYALGFGSYCGLVLHALGLPLLGWPDAVTQRVFAAAIAGAFIYINYRGVSETGLAGNIVTVAKLLVLAVFVAAGLWAIWRNPVVMAKFTPFAPEGLAGVLSAMGLTFVAFEGYEIIVQAGEEVKDPRRNIPRAVFWSLAIVVPVYLLVAFVALGVAPHAGMPSWQWLGRHAELGLAEAANHVMPYGTLLLLVGGLLATMSALNVTTFSSTRVSFAMGRDRTLPDAFAKVHAHTRTPWVALLASGTLILVMAVALPIQRVAAAADIMFLLLFLQVNIAAITVRKQYGDKLDYGYLMPFFPLVPILGVVAELGLVLYMFHYSALAWYVALGWLAAGCAVWLFYARARERGKGVTPVLLARRIPREKTRYRVLVPVANPETAKGLVRFAARLARQEEGELILLHTLVLPRQLPPSAGRVLAEQRRSLVDRAAALAAAEHVRYSVLVRVSHTQAWRAIVRTMEEYDVDFVVMGWRGRPRDPHTLVGHNIDQVIKQANCDAAILQELATPDAGRVLVPVADIHHGELALRVARLLAKPRGGHIDVLHVQRSKRGADESEELLNELARTGVPEGDTVSVSVEVVQARNPFGTILQRAADYDALVLGSTRQRWFRRTFFRTRPHAVTNKAKCPVVLVSRRTSAVKFGVQSFFQFFRDVGHKSPPPPPPDGAPQTKEPKKTHVS